MQSETQQYNFAGVVEVGASAGAAWSDEMASSAGAQPRV